MESQQKLGLGLDSDVSRTQKLAGKDQGNQFATANREPPSLPEGGENEMENEDAVSSQPFASSFATTTKCRCSLTQAKWKTIYSGRQPIIGRH